MPLRYRRPSDGNLVEFSTSAELILPIPYQAESSWNLSQAHLRLKMPSALVFLAEGAEEMETVITVDVLRRGGVRIQSTHFFPRTITESAPGIDLNVSVPLDLPWFLCV